MDDKMFFSGGHWIEAQAREACPVIRRDFVLESVPAEAVLHIVGFGMFEFYINGKRVGDEMYLPLASNYEERNYPLGEKMGVRTYVCEREVSRYLKEGKNVLAVILGNGWYTGIAMERPYGGKKVRFSLDMTGDDGKTFSVVSDSTAKWESSFIKESVFTGMEAHDYTFWEDECLFAEYDDSSWRYAVYSPSPESDYFVSDCPEDRVKEIKDVIFLRETNKGKIYDTGENVSGFPVLEATAQGKITVCFSEELCEDGDIDTENHGYAQRLTFVADKAGRVMFPHFCWQGFRYFAVKGNAKVIEVRKVHSDINAGSAFVSDNATLNWIYKTFLNTQLCNMHSGIPSDCPQIERRGYTGDGQLVCNASMTVLETDAVRRFYKKWLWDISDCQDRISGHVQYTAPYTHSGGGPGGWGCAIVTVPYYYWKHFGDDFFVREFYPQMKKYFEFLEAHSENQLVTSDRKGEWCLGEWCTPCQVILPAPFVNNYFYVKTLELACVIARHIGREEDIPEFEAAAQKRKDAIVSAYYNPWDGNFIGNMQGANAFAMDIGLGDGRTKKNFIEHYKKEPYYDTGIFGTELVTNMLFDLGETDTAFALLTADKPHGFGKWKKDGATTFWEYWGISRSHCHPMFGAVCECLIEDILGITQEEDSYGYEKAVIRPRVPESLNTVSGSTETVKGTFMAEYNRVGSKVYAKINIPTECTFVHPDGKCEKLRKGEHMLEV